MPFLLALLLLFSFVSFGLEFCQMEFTGISGNLGLLKCRGLNTHSIYSIELKKGNYKRDFWAYHPRKTDYLLFAVPYYWSGRIKFLLKRDGLTVAETALQVKPLNRRISYIVFGKDRNPTKVQSKRTVPHLGREEAYNLIRRTLRIYTPVRFFERRAIFPLKVFKRISSPFGVKRFINGRPAGFHKGVDIAAPEGTPVMATLSGKVVLARYLPLTGNTVIIDHGWGLMSLYAHLSRIEVKEGEFVRQGSIIGKVGSTGRSTGPHLHFGIYLNDVAVDPLEFLKLELKPAEGGKNFQSSNFKTLRKASCES